MAKPKIRANPYTAFNFKFSIVGTALTGVEDPIKTSGAFMECTGLDGENAMIEYREGTDQGKKGAGNFVRKLAGLERYPNVTLRRGITGDIGLYQWRNLVRDNPALRTAYVRNVNITLLDENHESMMAWLLTNAWPTKVAGPTLNAKSNEIAIESLELCCERLELVLK